MLRFEYNEQNARHADGIRQRFLLKKATKDCFSNDLLKLLFIDGTRVVLHFFFLFSILNRSLLCFSHLCKPSNQWQSGNARNWKTGGPGSNPGRAC